MPRTAISISRAPSIARSIKAFLPYSNASGIAESSCSGSFTFVMPTEDPSAAGFTNIGYPSRCARACTPSRSRSHTGSSTTSKGTTARPASRNRTFCTALSIPTAEPRTPAPTYGTPARSSIPWIVPSSPKRPCSTGNTTSTDSRNCTAWPGSKATIDGEVGSAGSTTDVPFSTSGSERPLICSDSGDASVSIHWPDGVMPIGSTSYFSGSRAAMTLPADTTEIPCSLLRPP